MSCSPNVGRVINSNLPPLDFDTEIHIIELGGTVPANSVHVGDLKIGDKGYTLNNQYTIDCSYEVVLKTAKKMARGSGANFIQITEVTEPTVLSTCYRIKARMYRNLDPQAIAEIKEVQNEKNKSRLSKDADFAVIHFYRPKNINGFLLSFDIKLEDGTVIGKMKNNSYFTHETKNFGQHTFWAETHVSGVMKTDGVTLDMKAGEEYFIRCGVNTESDIGRPDLFLIENRLGILEVQELADTLEKHP